MTDLTCIEICAGAGGQSVGLEEAGFGHLAAVEIDPDACETLRLNRKDWHVVERDVRHFSATEYLGSVDLLAGGVPCPPFSVAGKQLGADDERDLFPEALRLVEECDPNAVMLENVRGLSTVRFAEYRQEILDQLDVLGYEADWQVLNACEFGVPQLRPRFILVALKREMYPNFAWPRAEGTPQTVGQALGELMAEGGWSRAKDWAKRANGIGPTLVGGSRKHGGPDLGPTRARAGWEKLGVNGKGLADAPPTDGDDLGPDWMPKLTTKMAAVVQGFPTHWVFSGRKTASYRQIGNAFPPPVAKAVGKQIAKAINVSRGVVETPESQRLLRAV